MGLRRRLGLSAAALLAAGVSGAQTEAVKPQVITFMLDFPGHDVSHYVITLQPDGSGTYVALSTAGGGSSDLSFRLSAHDTQRWFDLARQAHYFAGPNGEIKHVAYTGTKTLTWNDGQKMPTSTQFSVTSSKPLQDLSSQAQSLALTLQLGESLASDLRFHPLQLDKDVSDTVDSLKSGVATHPEVIAEQLRAVASDPSVLGKVRRQADTILAALPAKQ